jgi:hypothetical protein
VVKGLTKVHTRIPSRVLARAQSAVPVLPPRLAVFEIVILLLMPALLEWQLPLFPALTTYQPHPYWVAVLLLSLQYGTVSGLLAAAVAIVATVIIGLPESDIGENHFAYLVRVWTQPVLWISAALLLGHFRIRQIEQRNDLTRTVEELQGRSAALTGHAQGLEARCDALERHLATRPKSDATALLNSLSTLPEAAAQGRWPTAFHAAMQAALPGSAATLYSVSTGGVQPVARSGMPLNGAAPRLEGNDALAVAVMQGRTLSVLSELDDGLLSGFGLFAVPVDGQHGGIAGILLVESLPPALIDQGTAARLRTLAAAFGGAMPSAEYILRTAADARAVVPARTTEPSIPIPVVPRWRQLRWLPAALRATDAARSEPADDDAPRRSTSSVSR